VSLRELDIPVRLAFLVHGGPAAFAFDNKNMKLNIAPQERQHLERGGWPPLSESGTGLPALQSAGRA